MLRSGLLEPSEIPGNPECPNKWRVLGAAGDLKYMVVRLGTQIAVTLHSKGASMMAVEPLRCRLR
jgi:hypothetical protein